MFNSPKFPSFRDKIFSENREYGSYVEWPIQNNCFYREYINRHKKKFFRLGTLFVPKAYYIFRGVTCLKGCSLPVVFFCKAL